MIVYLKFYDGLLEVGRFKQGKRALLQKKVMQVEITLTKAVKQQLLQNLELGEVGREYNAMICRGRANAEQTSKHLWSRIGCGGIKMRLRPPQVYQISLGNSLLTQLGAVK